MMPYKQHHRSNGKGLTVVILLGMLFVFPATSQATILQFTKAKRMGIQLNSGAQYNFEGNLRMVDGYQYPIDVQGTYANGIAKIRVNVFRPDKYNSIDGTAITRWKCSDDPWLNRTTKCSIHEQSEWCKDAPEFCTIMGRNLVPPQIVYLMRNGPPRPWVGGPSQATTSQAVGFTLKYSDDPAIGIDRCRIHEWYCPPGKDEKPDYVPTRLVSPWDGGACQSLVKGPRPTKLRRGSSVTKFPSLAGDGKPKAGIWYVQAQMLSYKYGKGMWSHWHRVAVVTGLKKITKPPAVLAPAQNQLFVNQGVNIKVRETNKRHDFRMWGFVFEWQRADYHTKANNAYAKKKWEQTNHGNYGYYPPALGLYSDELQPWLSPTRVQTMTEDYEPTTAQMSFSVLRSHRFDSSYLYRFRVREHNRNTRSYGPWSPWRRFIVQEPYQISIRSFMGSLGQKQGKQQFGQQQSRHFAPLAPVRRLNRPVRRLLKSKPTVGPRHATQQRGVRKKLTTPLAPVRRLNRPVRRLPKSKQAAGLRHATQQRGVRKKLTPAAPALRLAPLAPVRHLNLPMQLRLNR